MKNRHFILLGLVLVSLASVTPMASVVVTSATHSGRAASDTRQRLTLEERVAYQRAIEEVYWRHRLWPQENPQPKPPLDEVMPESLIRAKVEDSLRQSQALEVYWQRPITGEQLQAEMERMAQQTKQPEVLRELWAALQNDPFVIAECRARPVLVERLIRNWYASDERFHGELKRQAEEELSAPDAFARRREEVAQLKADEIRDMHTRPASCNAANPDNSVTVEFTISNEGHSPACEPSERSRERMLSLKSPQRVLQGGRALPSLGDFSGCQRFPVCSTGRQAAALT